MFLAKTIKVGKERNGDLGGTSFSGCHDKQFNAYKKTSKTLAMKISFHSLQLETSAVILNIRLKTQRSQLRIWERISFCGKGLDWTWGKSQYFILNK